ncbi:kinetochore protein Spc24 isoform X2 [Osmerus eperlanus]
MSQNSLEDFGEVLVGLVRSSRAEKELRLAGERLKTFYDRHLETKNTAAQILKNIMQSEDKASQKLLDQEEQKSQLDTELERLEAELQRATAKSHNMDSELQFLQRELDSLQHSEQELQVLQQEVDEDTTEVIPSTIYMAQLYYKVTRIKWEYDTEPHILRGVHYGADLASPIHMDTSVRSGCAVSDDLWNFVNTEW